MDNEELKMYLPEDVCPTFISREYLLSVRYYFIHIIILNNIQVLAFVDNELYLSLYEQYKEIKEERQAKKWGDYQINVINGVKGILNNFQSVDEKNGKITKPLRISKNGKEVGLVTKIEENAKKEKLQNVPKKFEPLSSINAKNSIDVEENNE